MSLTELIPSYSILSHLEKNSIKHNIDYAH